MCLNLMTKTDKIQEKINVELKTLFVFLSPNMANFGPASFITNTKGKLNLTADSVIHPGFIYTFYKFRSFPNRDQYHCTGCKKISRQRNIRGKGCLVNVANDIIERDP